MTKFPPYKIVVNGNDEDDILYEKWYTSEPRDNSKKPPDLEKMELRPRTGGPSQKDEIYETAVVKVLSQIKQYKTGQLVLAATLNLSADLYITPPGFRDSIANFNTDQIAFQICPTFETSASSNQFYTNNRVRFTPFLPKGYSCNETHISSTKDDTLLHELVHGARLGKLVASLINENTDDDWDNLEEFFATTVQNIYLSERGDKKVRSEHKTDIRTIPATRAASAEFMANKTNYQRVKTALKRENLAQQLAKLEQIPFNPFAEFERAKHDLRSI
ncbi:MAG: hypothetical protein IPK63_19660 [Candidatus Competibacteraceae bacterium]|nr:hypothetical protein [Candidatus Competibacteraceae bacterium]